MTTKVNVRRLHTTVGELIVAIMDAALGVSDSERDAYRLTGIVLNRMLDPVPVPAISPVIVSYRHPRARRRYDA